MQLDIDRESILVFDDNSEVELNDEVLGSGFEKVLSWRMVRVESKKAFAISSSFFINKFGKILRIEGLRLDSKRQLHDEVDEI